MSPSRNLQLPAPLSAVSFAFGLRLSAALLLPVPVPGVVMEHLLRRSDRTVAHWTFFTTIGTRAESSVLPREWLRAHAQWMSLMAGCASWKCILVKKYNFSALFVTHYALLKTNLIISYVDVLHR